MFTCGLSQTVIAQKTSRFIKGTLIDNVTKTGIGFASIGITNTTLGTAANEKGEFTLRIEDQYKSEQIKISCIGYITQTVKIDSLLLVNKDSITIKLMPDVALLDEIVLQAAPIDPAEIIKLTLSSLDKNYMQSPFNIELFSIINANDSVSGETFKVESIVNGYYEGYKPKGKKKFEIAHKRTTGNNPLKTINYGYWPSFEIHAADLLTTEYRKGIFNLDNLHKFKLKYAGVSIYENDTVYNIEYYAPKPTAKITGYGTVPKTYKGNIYITTSTNAVVRHEIETESFKYHVIYNKLGDKYFPYYFSGLRVNDFKLSGGKRKFKTFNTLVVTKVDLQNVKVIDENANESDINKVPYDEKYWSEFYPAGEAVSTHESAK